MADVQHRLTAVVPGAPVDADGIFGPATRAALEAFQRLRGLRVDGVCGPQTWNTLVEAGFRLGDRFVYRRTPMLRGDDVAELQQRLCALGFDTGRVDGIFGDATVRALGEFQRNAGLPVDGIVGGATLHELLRLESRHHDLDLELVSSVRARAALRDAPPTLRGRHVAVGESGGLGSVSGALRRRLTLGGTRVTELHHPDDAVKAKEANELDVDVFVGLRLNPSSSACRTAFWSGTHDESPVGAGWPSSSSAACPMPWASPMPVCTACRCPCCARPGCPPCSSRWARRAPWSSGPPPSWPPLSVALGRWADASWE